MSQKIIFLDIDGTLVDYEGNIPQSAQQAISRARFQGHQVLICSGRSKAEIYPELWDLGLDGFIGANGAYIEYQGRVLFHQTFSAETNSILVDWLQERGLGFYLEANSGLYASPNFLEQAATIYGEATSENISRLAKMFPDMIYGENLYRSDINKISFRLKYLEHLTEAQTTFPNVEVGFWSGTGSQEPEFGEFGQPDLDKALAIERLLTELKIEIADSIAFGDGSNDRSMIAFCGVGVAMGNSGADLKELADYVTSSVTEDGLYKGFIHLGLIKEG